MYVQPRGEIYGITNSAQPSRSPKKMNNISHSSQTHKIINQQLVFSRARAAVARLTTLNTRIGMSAESPARSPGKPEATADNLRLTREYVLNRSNIQAKWLAYQTANLQAERSKVFCLF